MTTPRQDVAWQDLLRSWDRQQDVYIECRDRVFEVLLEVLAELVPTADPKILDLACGPGAISERLLARFAGARCVAVDVDPVLLTIGQNALGDAGGRLRWARTDLRDPDWHLGLGEDAADGSFDAVVTSTALHWLTPVALAATYRRAFALLRPGGVLLNSDYLPHPPGTRLHALCESIAGHRQVAAVSRGVDDWAGWWAKVEAEPALADAVAERARLWPDGARDWTGASDRFHRAALVEAGFAEVGTVWQDLSQRIVVALK